MTPPLRHTLCEHALGNYRVLTTLANELLTTAAQRELPELDEKLYFEVFAPATPSSRRTPTRQSSAAR
jgi:general secretion pathway protein A